MPTWDLLSETFTNLDDWTDADAGNGECEIDPAGQVRLDANTAAATNYSKISQDVGTIPDEATVEIELYHDLIGTQGNEDHFLLVIPQAAEQFAFRFTSGGLTAVDDGGNTEIGTDLVLSGASAAWQTWRFVISASGTGAATCNVYLDDSTNYWEPVGSTVSCSTAGSYTDGLISLTQYGQTTNGMVTHVAYIRAYSGLYECYPTYGQIKDGHELIPNRGINIERASNGDPRGQRLYTANRQTFKVIHSFTAAEKAAHETWCDTNVDEEFTFVYAVDNEGYNCLLMDARYYPITTDRFRAEVMLTQKDTD